MYADLQLFVIGNSLPHTHAHALGQAGDAARNGGGRREARSTCSSSLDHRVHAMFGGACDVVCARVRTHLVGPGMLRLVDARSVV